MIGIIKNIKKCSPTTIHFEACIHIWFKNIKSCVLYKIQWLLNYWNQAKSCRAFRISNICGITHNQPKLIKNKIIK